MTLQEFADITIDVLREDGLAEYLPTFAFPDTEEIRAIQGIPVTVDHRDAIQNVVKRSGYGTREFFFGVRSAPDQVTVGHYRPDRATKFMAITETDDDYSSRKLTSCPWWKVS